MAPPKKATPQMRAAWKDFEKVAKQQTKELVKLKVEAVHYRAQYDRLLADAQRCFDILATASAVLRTALLEREYPVDVLSAAKKED